METRQNRASVWLLIYALGCVLVHCSVGCARPPRRRTLAPLHGVHSRSHIGCECARLWVRRRLRSLSDGMAPMRLRLHWVRQGQRRTTLGAPTRTANVTFKASALLPAVRLPRRMCVPTEVTGPRRRRQEADVGGGYHTLQRLPACLPVACAGRRAARCQAAPPTRIAISRRRRRVHVMPYTTYTLPTQLTLAELTDAPVRVDNRALGVGWSSVPLTLLLPHPPTSPS